MPLGFYMDHHVPSAITNGLRLRGVDVLTAHEDGTQRLEDPALLDRAGALGRVLFTRDDDFFEGSGPSAAAGNFLRRCDLCSSVACVHWCLHREPGAYCESRGTA